VPDTEYYNKAGTTLVGKTDPEGFFAAVLDSPVQTEGNFNEATGMNSDWSTVAGNTCNSWTSSLGTNKAAVGWLAATGKSTADMLRGGFVGCNTALRFMCITGPF
jgi:hypothetical protein